MAHGWFVRLAVAAHRVGRDAFSEQNFSRYGILRDRSGIRERRLRVTA